MRKLLLSVLLSLLVIGLLAACEPERDQVNSTNPTNENGNVESTTEGEASLPEKPEELVLWADTDEITLPAYREIVKRYEEETGIPVRIVNMAMADQTDNISLDGPSGTGPDVWYQAHDRVGEAVVQNLATPIEVDGEKLTGYYPDAIRGLTYNGELYGLPMIIETWALYYNKSIIPEAPATMEELEQLSVEFNDPSENKYGFLLRGDSPFFMSSIMNAYGGYFFGYDETGFIGNDVGLANEGAIEGGKVVQSWFENGYLPQGVNQDIMVGLFSEGTVGAIGHFPFLIPTLKEAIGDDLATAPLPKLANGERPASFIAVQSWLVSNFSEHKYWANDLALFLTSEESLSYFFEETGQLPPRTDLLNSDLVLDNEYYKGFVEQLEHSDLMPNIPEIMQIWGPLRDAFHHISQGEDVGEVLTETQEYVELQIEMVHGSN